MDRSSPGGHSVSSSRSACLQQPREVGAWVCETQFLISSSSSNIDVVSVQLGAQLPKLVNVTGVQHHPLLLPTNFSLSKRCLAFISSDANTVVPN